MKSIVKISRFSLIATLAAGMAAAGIQRVAAAGITTWSGGGGADQNWSTAANWTTVGGGTPPAAGDAVIFRATGSAASAGVVNSIVDAGFTAAMGSLMFTNETASTFHTVQIPSGTTLTVNGPIVVGGTNNAQTFTFTGGGTLKGGTGASAFTIHTENSDPAVTLDLSGLTNFIFNAGGVGGAFSMTLDLGFHSSAILNLAAVSNNITATTLTIGNNNSGGSATLNLGAGTNIINANTVEIGDNKVNGTLQFGSATGSLRLRNAAGSGSATVRMAGNPSHSGSASATTVSTVSLNGHSVDMMIGTLTMADRVARAGGSDNAYFSFDTGVVNCTAINMATNIAGGTAPVAQMSVGGGTLNVANGISLVGCGGTAGTGTLIITNGGRVNAGSIVKSTTTGTGIVSVTNATLAITSGSGGLGSFGAPLDVLNLENASLRLKLDANFIGNTTVVAATINANGLNHLAIDSIANASGTQTFGLINYQNPADDPWNSFLNGSVTNVTLPPGYSGYVWDDTGSQTIQLTVTAPITYPVTWVGATNSVLVSVWDTNKTANWTDGSNPTVYTDGDPVTFDDSGLTNLVTLITSNAPSSITLNNNSVDYIVNGAGKITGSTSITKNGSGTFMLADSGGDDFSGDITLNGGTFIFDNTNSAIAGGLTIYATAQIGNNDGGGKLPSGTLDDEGMLVYNRADNVAVSTAINGGGGLTQAGAGALTLTVSNGLYGQVLVSRGKLALTAANAISSSYQLFITNGTFDISAISGHVGLMDLNISNATINLGVSSSTQASLGVNSFESDGTLGKSNVINVTSLPGIAGYPATVTLIQSTNGIYLAGGNFNFALGSLPAASPSYVGSLSDSGDGTAILLTLTAGPTGSRAQVVWNGTNNVSANTNWSDGLNWQLPGEPGAADIVVFNDQVSVFDSTINNVVDAGFGGTISSLTYSQIGNGDYQNTFIPGGMTLNVTGTGGLTVGLSTALSSAASPVTTISGAGALVVNNSSANVNVTVGEPSTSGTVVLNMTNLNTFDFTGARLMIGVAGPARSTGVLYLAQTNLISLSGSSPQLDIGDNSGNNGSGSALYLGQTNAIFADSIAMGRSKQNSGGGGRMLFNPATANPVAYFRGADGVSPVNTWAIADGSTGGGTITDTGTSDFSGGTVDILVNSMWLARNGSGASGGSSANNATLTFSAGSIVANNLTNAMLSSSARTPTVTGTVNVNGGILTVNNVLAMAAMNGYTGTANSTLNIAGGTVLANSIVAGGGNSTISLADGTLSVSNNAGTLALPIGTLNLTDSGANDTRLNLRVAAGVTNICATTINASGTTTINIASIAGFTSTTQIPLISYTGASPMAGLALGAIPSGYTGASLVDSGTTIDLLITPPAPKIWAGAVGSTPDGNWDFSTLNWQQGGLPIAYADIDFAQFDDTASIGTVTLTTTLSPANITVNNNVLDYTFIGSGRLHGNAALLKQGTGSLILDNSGTNDFTGGVNLAGGTLQIGNNDANGNLPAGNVVDNGNLAFNRSDSNTVASVISGAGSVTQNGTGTNLLAAINTYSGATVISSGMIIAANAAGGVSSIGSTAGACIITNGGTLDIEYPTQNTMSFTNTTDDGGKQFFIAGAGVGGNGAIVNNGTTNQIEALQDLTLTADATVGGPARWDLRVPNGHYQPILDLGGFTLTKSGSNQMSMVAVIVTNGGSIVINSGILSFETISSNATTPITVNAGGVLGHYRENAGLFTAPITLNGGMIRDLNGTPGSTNDSPITLTADSFLDLNVGSSDLIQLNGVISESGGSFGFTKTNAGTYALSAVNTYSGTTYVAQGRLMLVGNGSIAQSRLINVAAGATLDASQRNDGALTLNAGQTLSGSGTVNGAVTNSVGATIAPGSPAGVGTLAFANNLTLAGTTRMKLDRTAGATNDGLSVAGALAEGGALDIALNGGTFAAGDTFTLFSATGGISGAFTATNLPALPGGLGWVTTNLANGVLSIVATVNPNPTNVTAVVSGNTLTLSWPADHTGWRLQVQTNSLGAGLGGNWVDVPGSTNLNNEVITVDPGQGTVFYRMVYP